MREQQVERSFQTRVFVRDLVLYTAARLSMLAVAIVILTLCGVPLLVASIVSVILVMPLSMLVFGALRRRVAAGIAERAEHRRQRRAELEAQLRGERDDEG